MGAWGRPGAPEGLRGETAVAGAAVPLKPGRHLWVQDAGRTFSLERQGVILQGLGV